jgi:hypothetical protein
MKKYLALAALLLAGNVYAAEESAVAAPETKGVEQASETKEIVISEQELQAAVDTANTIVKAMEEAAQNEAAQDAKNS